MQLPTERCQGRGSHTSRGQHTRCTGADVHAVPLIVKSTLGTEWRPRDPDLVPPSHLPVGACEGLYLPRAPLPWALHLL